MKLSHFLREFESEFLESLYELDRQEAERVQQCGCPYCGGILDSAYYWRRPRGFETLKRKYKVRFSFCCRVCRRRTTPSSVRILGRKVYLGLVVVLMSYQRQRGERVLMKQLVSTCGAAEITIRRWLHWWQEPVRESNFWKAGRAFFIPPLNEETLACSLYERFKQLSSGIKETMSKLLGFLRPITSPRQYPC